MTKKNETASETPRFTPATYRTLAEFWRRQGGAYTNETAQALDYAADVLEAQQQEIDRLQVELKGWQMSHAKLYAVRTGEPERTP